MSAAKHLQTTGTEKTPRVPTSSECTTVDARSTARASIYLAAALYCDGSSSPVKIRNISATGALLEAPAAPAAGALVQLVRGGLIVHALIIWSNEGRCGLKFSGSVDVERWRASPANAEQQRIDEVVRLVKAGAVPLPVPTLGVPRPDEENAGPVEQRSADFRRVLNLLDHLTEVLGGDSEIVAQHGRALQNLDIAMQLVAAMDPAGNDGSGHDEGAKISGLRRSADQALRRRS